MSHRGGTESHGMLSEKLTELGTEASTPFGCIMAVVALFRGGGQLQDQSASWAHTPPHPPALRVATCCLALAVGCAVAGRRAGVTRLVGCSKQRCTSCSTVVQTSREVLQPPPKSPQGSQLVLSVGVGFGALMII